MFFIDVWEGSKYTSGDSFVSEIMLAIDDFSLNSWFEWKNQTLVSAKVILFDAIH